MASTFTEIQSAISTTIRTVDTDGQIVIRQALPSNWPEFLKLFKTTVNGHSTIRGWIIVAGEPFKQVDVEAIGGAYRDVYRFELFCVQSAQDTDASYTDSLDLVNRVAEALDANQTLSGVTAEVFFAGPCSIRFHEFRMFGNVSVWYTDLMYDVTINRQVTYV